MGQPNCLTGLVLSQEHGCHSHAYITDGAGKASVCIKKSITVSKSQL